MGVKSRKLSGYRVYCDESNTDSHKPHPVYGAILVALDDIREVQHELATGDAEKRCTANSNGKRCVAANGAEPEIPFQQAQQKVSHSIVPA